MSLADRISIARGEASWARGEMQDAKREFGIKSQQYKDAKANYEKAENERKELEKLEREGKQSVAPETSKKSRMPRDYKDMNDEQLRSNLSKAEDALEKANRTLEKNKPENRPITRTLATAKKMREAYEKAEKDKRRSVNAINKINAELKRRKK